MKHPFFDQARRGYHHGRLKDALIEAALSLIAQRGLHGFTLAEAAKLVGVTAAAPYRHFSDRDDLMGELARRGFEQFGARLKTAWNAGRPDPQTAFHNMGQAYLAFARDEPGLYMAMFGNAQALGPQGPADPGAAAMDSLIGAAAKYPKFKGKKQAVYTLERQIVHCVRAGILGKPPAYDSPEMIDLVVYLTQLSKGASMGAQFIR